MVAYYNEIDPLAARTIREAMDRGLVAPGVVDERDIRDVRPDELAGFAQCHFFAGAGIWSYALRDAGWSDDRAVWTCSCPCQPFSKAGKGAGFADERHLWPAYHWLAEQQRPVVMLGEQVDGGDADLWLDLVQADLEAMDYAFGCVPLASAGFGAPNIRHRNYWMAHANGARLEGRIGMSERPDQLAARPDGLVDGLGHADSRGWTTGFVTVASAGHGKSAIPASAAGWMGNPNREPERRGSGEEATPEICGEGEVGRQDREWLWAIGGRAGAVGGLADATGERHEWAGLARGWRDGPADGGDPLRVADAMRAGRPERGAIAGDGSATGSGVDGDRDPGPVNGFWRDADWLLCRDPGGARWRPVDAGTFPLAPGNSSRVGGLRISGNAINAEVAKGFIQAVIAELDGAPMAEAA